MLNLLTVNQILNAVAAGAFQPAVGASPATWAVGGLDSTLYPVESAVVACLGGWFVIIYQTAGGPGLTVECASATVGAAYQLDTGVAGGWVAAY